MIASTDNTRARGRHLLATVITVLGFVWGASGCDHSDAPAAPATSPRALSSSRPTTDDRRPTRLTIPAIQVRTSVVQLGLNADRTVEVPSHPAQVGWYRFGSVPGRSGSTVILGHVDSDHGPAVFYKLRLLATGARIDLQLADGSHVRFLVDKLALYPNDKFPAASVYAADGPSRLTLVTCGGTYDASRGGYQANLVVSARLVGSASIGTSGG